VFIERFGVHGGHGVYVRGRGTDSGSPKLRAAIAKDALYPYHKPNHKH